jgi:DNA-binding Lrp family transcriptional regulator
MFRGSLLTFAGILTLMVARRGEESGIERAGDAHGPGHFPRSLLYAAAKMYYDEDATQAEVAAKLGTSRATISRILSEARRQGIVRIEVIPPDHRGADDLAERVAAALGLNTVHISAPLPVSGNKPMEDVLGSVLAPAVGRALSAVGLAQGDVLLVSSGRTIYEVARFDLPRLPGVVVAPTVGGPDDPARAAPVAAGPLRADRDRGPAAAALPSAAVRGPVRDRPDRRGRRHLLAVLQPSRQVGDLPR